MQGFMPQTAMIFAAGLGTRMRPITNHTPKPLVEVAGKRLLDYRLDSLVAAGVQRVVINTHYLANQIAEHVKHRSDIEIIISHEPEILETGGGILNAAEYLGDDPIFVMNSDVVLLDSPNELTALQRLASCWRQHEMDLLMLMQPCEKAVGYVGQGDFELDEIGHVIRPHTPPFSLVFSGTQILRWQVLKDFDERKFSLSKLFAASLDVTSKHYSRAHGLLHKGDWLHVDSPEALAQAESFLQA